MGGVVRSSVGEANAGDASEGEEVKLVRLGGGTDEAAVTPNHVLRSFHRMGRRHKDG
jgi:hypothetical protein